MREQVMIMWLSLREVQEIETSRRACCNVHQTQQVVFTNLGARVAVIVSSEQCWTKYLHLCPQNKGVKVIRRGRAKARATMAMAMVQGR